MISNVNTMNFKFRDNLFANVAQLSDIPKRPCIIIISLPLP